MCSSLICIGDIHGHLSKLISLWNNLEAFMGKIALECTTVVFLGDYCDKGPNTKGVIDWLINLRDSREPGKTIFLAGNHDFSMARYLNCAPVSNGQNFQEGKRWERSNKSRYTFSSYGVRYDPRNGREMKERFSEQVPESHREFLKGLKWIYEANIDEFDRDIICTHAGLPNFENEADLQQLISLMRDRNHLVAKSLFSRQTVVNAPKILSDSHVVISGHHGKRLITDDRIIIDRGAGQKQNPIEAIYLPTRTIISSTT